MVASKLDLKEENAVEIGADYSLTIQLCGADDLTLYQGICNIKASLDSAEILLSPTIQIVNKDTFNINIAFSNYPPTVVAGNYIYDVLFYKTDKRFYAIEGKIQVLKRVTTV